jgi:hypothetical protein
MPKFLSYAIPFCFAAIIALCSYLVARAEIEPRCVILNPGDPTEVLVWKSLDKAKLKLTDYAGGCMTPDGSRIHLQKGYSEALLLHVFCHLVDRCLGDVEIALNRVRGLPIETFHVLDVLHSEQMVLSTGKRESLWRTLQRRYQYDIIQHEVLRNMLLEGKDVTPIVMP